MEYQKTLNLSDDTMNERYKFRTGNWIGINDELQGAYYV